MAETVEAIVAGTTYSLSGGNPYHYLFLTGVGLANIRIQKERGPYQDGYTPRGFLFDERLLGLGLLITGETLAEVDGYRDDLAQILAPVDEETPLKLRITREDGSQRQMDCFAAGLIDMPNTPMQDRMGASQRVVATLEAGDPFPYDPILQQLSFSTVLGIAIPAAVPLVTQSSAAIYNAVETVNYPGTRLVYPTITITGPITDCVITNETTGHVLDFTGTTIADGDTYTITLAYGNKTITDSAGANKIATLTDASDLAEWHLAAHPKAPDGNNDIRVEGATVTDATRVRLAWYNRYLSV